MPSSAPTLHFTAETGRPALPYLRRELKRAVALLPPNRLTEVAIALVGDATMSALHARSHGDPAPTDVLTYELDHTPGGDVTEGQIVICVPEARRRVADHPGGHTMGLPAELLLYALHGLLHLCGMDDRTARGFKQMHETEDKILTAIGVGSVFAPAPKPQALPSARKAKASGARPVRQSGTGGGRRPGTSGGRRR